VVYVVNCVVIGGFVVVVVGELSVDDISMLVGLY